MAAIAYNKARIRPTTDVGCILPPLKAGEAMTLGNTVELQTDGTIDESGAETALGIVVSQSVGFPGPTGDVAENDSVGVLIWGLVSGFSGLEPGDVVYLGADGELQDTGDVPCGMALNETDILFNFLSFIAPTVVEAPGGGD